MYKFIFIIIFLLTGCYKTYSNEEADNSYNYHEQMNKKTNSLAWNDKKLLNNIGVTLIYTDNISFLANTLSLCNVTSKQSIKKLFQWDEFQSYNLKSDIGNITVERFKVTDYGKRIDISTKSKRLANYFMDVNDVACADIFRFYYVISKGDYLYFLRTEENIFYKNKLKIPAMEYRTMRNYIKIYREYKVDDVAQLIEEYGD